MSTTSPIIYNNGQDLINNIKTLQTMEQQLFSSLETTPNMSSAQQKSIVQKIDDLSKMRINLYKTLGNVNKYAQNNLNTSVDSLQQQITAISIVENELNRAKARLDVLEDEKYSKLRLVEINNYYSDKYHEHSELMKIIIFTLLPIIIMNYIYNRGILPYNIFLVIISVVTVIGGYFFWNRLASILMRDNMNYNKYDWAVKLPSIASTGRVDDPWFTGSLPSITCIGSGCCSDGMTYDTIQDRCVFASSPASVDGSVSSSADTSNPSSSSANQSSSSATNSTNVLSSFSRFF